MKYVAIAMFIFIIQVSVAFTNATGLFSPHMSEHNEWLSVVSETEINNENYQGSKLSEFINTFGDYVRGLWYFIKTFALGTIVFSYTLKEFGLTAPYTIILNLVVWFIYILGITQFIANRTTKSMG